VHNRSKIPKIPTPQKNILLIINKHPSAENNSDQTGPGQHRRGKTAKPPPPHRGVLDDRSMRSSLPGIPDPAACQSGSLPTPLLFPKKPGSQKQTATVNVSAPGIPVHAKETDVRLSDRGSNGRDRREMETAHPLEDQGRTAPFRSNPGETAGDLPENAHPPAQGP
jgi:hypothetical protein